MIKMFIILWIMISTSLFSNEIEDRCNNVIKSYYKQDIKLINKEFIISSSIKSKIENEIKQRFYRNKIYYWVIENSGKLNYALLDNSIGKTMPITFLVIFDDKMEIIHSSIIKYRESHGGEVSGKKWLAQFNGMKRNSNYKFGKEIDGITGATISVKSITKGINKLSLLLPYIIEGSNKIN